MQYDKYDLEVRSKYLVQIIYVKQALVSLIFSNKSFLLISLCLSLLLLLLIQCSILKKQYKTLKKKIPYKFFRNIWNILNILNIWNYILINSIVSIQYKLMKIMDSDVKFLLIATRLTKLKIYSPLIDFQKLNLKLHIISVVLLISYP